MPITSMIFGVMLLVSGFTRGEEPGDRADGTNATDATLTTSPNPSPTPTPNADAKRPDDTALWEAEWDDDDAFGRQATPIASSDPSALTAEDTKTSSKERPRRKPLEKLEHEPIELVPEEHDEAPRLRPRDAKPGVSSAAFTLIDGYNIQPADGDNVRVVFGEGFTAQTRDGAFAFNVRARMQLRATGSGPSPQGDSSTFGFMVRRARLVVQGHLFDKRWEYYLQLGFANLDMEPDLRIPLRDAVLTWARFRDFQLRLGQMKTPFDRQRVISSSALMFTDRSIVTQELNLDRDVGVQAFSRDLFGLGQRLGYQVGVYGGDGRNRLTTDTNVLVVARVQVSPFGGSQADFDDYAESVAERPVTPKLALAGGVAYNHRTNRALSTLGETYQFARFSYLHAETDFIFKWRGLSWQGQWLMRRANRGSETEVIDGASLTEVSRSGWGWFTQLGYRFVVPFEMAARYGELYPLRRETAVELRRELGPGLSYYFHDHALKLQADYFYLFGDEIQRGRHEARLQMQLFF